MSERRQVWATLAELLGRIEAGVERETAVIDLAPIHQELRKLGKTQFKTNTLTENQLSQQQTALSQLEVLQAENNALQKKAQDDQQTLLNQQMLLAILPALDGLEQAMMSGAKYLTKRDKVAAREDLTAVQAQLVSPADRAMLASWLNGLRLVQERLQAILEAGGVTIIPSVGHTFDPFCHKAVGTTATPTNDPAITPNTIVREERRGYRTTTGVLRFAEVVVYRPPNIKADTGK